MIDPGILDDFAKRLSDIIPDSAQGLRHDVEKNVRAVINSTFTKLDLITREEFEVQKNVLARSRTKIEALEQQLTELETRLQEK